MNFSLLVPTRKRQQSLLQMLDSVKATAAKPEKIEVLIAHDIDERFHQSTIKKIHSTDLNTQIFKRERSSFLNEDYYNWLAKKSTGKYLWPIGDDVRFLTPNWDTILSEEIEKELQNKPDRILYIETEDGTEAKHCCFPLVTREVLNFFGQIFHPSILTWGADRTLYEVMGHPSIKRTLKVMRVSLDHISYHDGKAPMDETAKSVRNRFMSDPQQHNRVTAFIVPKQIELLAKYLTEKSNGME